MCVCVCVFVGEWVSGCCWHNKWQTLDRNDLKLGTVVVLDTTSKPIDFGFKRSGFTVMVRVGVGVGDGMGWGYGYSLRFRFRV